MRAWVRRGRNFLARPAVEQLALPIAVLALALARLAIRVLSFRRIAGWLGHELGPAGWVHLVSPEDATQARHVARMVRWAARRSPLEANCFPQALVALLWLRRAHVPAAVFFGVMRSGAGELRAHAWVVCGPVAVTGGESFSTFAVVAGFASPPPQSPGTARKEQRR